MHNGPHKAEVATLPDGHGHRTKEPFIVPGCDGAVGHSRSERRHPAKMATRTKAVPPDGQGCNLGE